MRKIIIVFLIAIIINTSFNQKNYIPDESIRFRILANSNSSSDQKAKWDITQKIIPFLKLESNNYTDAKKELSSNISLIENELDQFNIEYQIEYGSHFFPKKEYKNVIYPEGYYESLLIKLGDANGDNWWCVMYPPLCTLESNGLTDIEYTTLINEFINH